MACDICGCGVGNTYIGILPEFRSSILGIRYRYNSLITHVGVGGTTSYLTTNEYYKTAELWGGFFIGKKIRFLGAIPYNINSRFNQGKTNDKQGLGDITTTAYYALLNNTTTLKNKLIVHSLWVGTGVKFPTGNYNSIDKMNANSNNLFQLGTGSIDFSVNAMYDLRYQDIGINVSASHTMNTQNKYQYLYGNKITMSSQFYYKFSVASRLSIAPNIGVLLEKANQDEDNGAVVELSGGRLVMGSVGLETSYKKIAFGLSWQSPMRQYLANGIIQVNDRTMVHLSMIL